MYLTTIAHSAKGSSVRITLYVAVTECTVLVYICTVRIRYVTQNSESKNPELRIKCEK